MRTPEIVMAICCLLAGCSAYAQTNADFAAKREQMVKQQIIARGIHDTKVLNAMRKVKRHLFVPPDLALQAYDDRPLTIGQGQTISQPYIVAYMTEALDLRTSDKVLEIGTGSGYQAAILSELCDSVFSVEIIPSLGEKASALLKSLNYRNVHIKIGDGYEGWVAHAPYQAIIVTCSPSHVPQPLIDQLDEGGKMIIPVGKTFNQQLIVLVKSKGQLIQHNVLPVRFVPMMDKNNNEY
jgi:protein-L-isoaspartate(D-aspartate) O-methyltransferase